MPKFIFEDSNSKLKYLIDHCQSLDDLDKIYTNEQRSALVSGTFYRNFFKKAHHSPVASAFIEAIDLSSNPIDLFWILISFIGLGAAALWLASLVSLITLILFVGGFYYYLRTHRNQASKDKKWIQLAIIKIQALNELLRRNQPLDWAYSENSILEKKPQCSKSASLALGLSTAIILLTTFYWGITDSLLILELISATSILASPIGLAIAAVAALIIGSIVAAKHYQTRNSNALIKTVKNQLQAEGTHKKILLSCFMQFKKKAHSSALAVPAEEKYHPRPALAVPVEEKYQPRLKRSVSQTFFRKEEGVNVLKGFQQPPEHGTTRKFRPYRATALD